jgi:UDP-N-acetylmuramate dehydrogenase
VTTSFARNVPLADYTTLGLGGPAARFCSVASTDELIATVRDVDRSGDPLLVLGGGSNLVVADEGFAGTVIQVDSSDLSYTEVDDTVVRVRVDAGMEWDSFVARCVDEGLSGVEALSGIPGRVGATPIQNVGAYGQDISQTVVEVTVYDRAADRTRVLSAAECGFAYRTSIFKGRDRYVVCDVVFELTRSKLSRPIRYAELARSLGVSQGDQVPLADVRDAVLSLRRSKGMVLDPADPDTRSAGSFFTNPILSADEFARFTQRVAEVLGPEVTPPAYPDGDGRVKTSAAWLIERAGFPKGYGTGPVGISTKHTLALTNRGGATTADLLALAREVRAGVARVFGITLVNEPVMIGVTL